MTPRRIYWWREGCIGATADNSPNFGDELVPLILQMAHVEQFEWASPQDSNRLDGFVIAGSVLEHLPPDWEGTVCGAGLLHEGARIDLSRARVLGLRGYLTLDRVDLGPRSSRNDIVLGDPALLVPSWIRQYAARWDLGVIPHWSDKELFKRYPYGRLIDVRRPPQEVVEEIAKCKRVISSSLHGIIVADAYGIPRQAERFPDMVTRAQHEGGDFKFYDYATIYDGDPHFGEMWKAPYETVAKVQHDLRVMLARATQTTPPPVISTPPVQRGSWWWPFHWPRFDRPQVSLLVPFRDDHEFRARVWDWLQLYWRDHLFSVEVVEGYDAGVPFCVDQETQMLTLSGWKYYDEVQVGELALTLDHITGLSEWRPVEAINVFDVVDEPMLYSEGWAHSSLTTMNHRWPVVRRSGNGHRRQRAGFRGGRGWTTSEALTAGDQVPISAECSDLPTVPKYTDAFVEIVAWAWTEGTFGHPEKRSGSGAITISQSGEVNPRNCERIRAALTAFVGPPADRLDGSGTQWREYLEGRQAGSISRFRIGAQAARAIREVAPGRVPTVEFLLALTRAQLSLFIDVSILADGTSGTCGTSLAQKDPKAAEAFQFACILAGHATSIRKISMPEVKRAKYGYDMTNVHLRTGNVVAPTNQKLCEPRSYTGKIWCPTTGNGTWLARRNGSVYFTGNSKAVAVNDAASRARGSVFVILDADAYLDTRFVQQYVDNIIVATLTGRRLWYIPYDKLYRLSQPATLALLETNPKHRYRFSSPPPPDVLDSSPLNPHDHNSIHYGHKYGALIQMMPREAFFMAGGMDPRFRGWGSEDAAFMHAVDTIYCQHELGHNDAVHLWHARPGISWDTRRWIGQPDVVANSRLAQRYMAATSEPGWMKALTQEYPPPPDTLRWRWRWP